MIKTPAERVSEAMSKARVAGFSNGRRYDSGERMNINMDEARSELTAYVIQLNDRAVRAESQVKYLTSSWWNRFRTYVGCAFARHYARVEDISTKSSNSQNIAKEL